MYSIYVDDFVCRFKHGQTPYLKCVFGVKWSGTTHRLEDVLATTKLGDVVY